MVTRLLLQGDYYDGRYDDDDGSDDDDYYDDMPALEEPDDAYYSIPVKCFIYPLPPTPMNE